MTRVEIWKYFFKKVIIPVLLTAEKGVSNFQDE